MGREAEIICEWNHQKTQVKAIIEPPELILRGGIRRRIPFSEIKQLRTDDDKLHFGFEGESSTLELGSKLAVKWVEAIQTHPPTLAKKLGISKDSVVRMVGVLDDIALQEALSSAKSISNVGANLIVARVDIHADLSGAFSTTANQLVAGVPIWLIYPKGRGHALSEQDVRATGLAAGMVDTKVAAVSSTLTGLRFVKRRNA